MYPTQPSNQLHGEQPFVSDGTCARFVKVRDEWQMSLAPGLAALVRVGTTVTCDVETRAGKRYARSGTVIRTQVMRDGTPRALCRIEEFRAGRASDERNTFAMLPNGDWGVRLHASASRRSRIGDTVEVAVTAKSGRVAHVKARVTDIVENEHRDRQAIAEILERDNGRSREPRFEASHGVTESCPVCGTTACDSGITGRCTISPEQHPREFGDIPLADTPREDFDTHVEPIALAQDWDHWSETKCLQPVDLTIFWSPSPVRITGSVTGFRARTGAPRGHVERSREPNSPERTPPAARRSRAHCVVLRPLSSPPESPNGWMPNRRRGR